MDPFIVEHIEMEQLELERREEEAELCAKAIYELYESSSSSMSFPLCISRLITFYVFGADGSKAQFLRNSGKKMRIGWIVPYRRHARGHPVL